MLKTLIQKQIHQDFSNMTREEQELVMLDKSKSAIRKRVEMLLEEKTKQLQTKEEMEAMEAKQKEQEELEK